jgi:hypothetical protein
MRESPAEHLHSRPLSGEPDCRKPTPDAALIRLRSLTTFRSCATYDPRTDLELVETEKVCASLVPGPGFQVGGPGR